MMNVNLFFWILRHVHGPPTHPTDTGAKRDTKQLNFVKLLCLFKAVLWSFSVSWLFTSISDHCALFVGMLHIILVILTSCFGLFTSLSISFASFCIWFVSLYGHFESLCVSFDSFVSVYASFCIPFASFCGVFVCLFVVNWRLFNIIQLLFSVTFCRWSPSGPSDHYTSAQ